MGNVLGIIGTLLEYYLSISYRPKAYHNLPTPKVGTYGPGHGSGKMLYKFSESV